MRGSGWINVYSSVAWLLNMNDDRTQIQQLLFFPPALLMIVGTILVVITLPIPDHLSLA
jgi:hypothetical protein